MRQLFFVLLMALCAACNVSTAEQFQEGKHYAKLAKPQADGGDKVEVMEFFWYGCPHCADFEPHINQWKAKAPKNVKVTLVPAIFRPQWTLDAKVYYALELLGLVDSVHSKIFEQIHTHNKPHNTPEQYAEMLAGFGVEKQELLDAMNSFVVDSQVRQAGKMIQEYRIAGVPTVAVNGKYTTGAGMAGGYQEMLEVVDYLVAKESK